MLYKSTCFFFSLYYPPIPWVSIMQRGVYPFLVFVAIADADGQRQGRAGKRRPERQEPEARNDPGAGRNGGGFRPGLRPHGARGFGALRADRERARLRRRGTGTRDSWRAGASCVPRARRDGGIWEDRGRGERGSLPHWVGRSAESFDGSALGTESFRNLKGGVVSSASVPLASNHE